MRPLYATALLTLALAVPAAASANTVVGSALDSAGTFVACDGDPAAPCVLIQDTIEGQPVRTPAGVITGWRVIGSGPVSLRVVRPTTISPTLFQGQLVDELDGVETSGSGDVEGFTLTPGFPVRAGDTIGVALLDAGSQVGARAADLAEGTRDFEDEDGPSISTTDAEPLEIFSQVDVEPDVDADGLGDETQDSCVRCSPPRPADPVAPSTTVKPDPYAAIRAKGPSVTIARSAKVSRGRVALVTLTNPYAFELKGKLSIRPASGRSRRTALGKASFRLASKARGAVRVKLSKAAFRRLVRRKRMRVLATVKAQAPVGRSRTTRQKVTLKAPARKKKRKPAVRKPATPPGSGLPVTGSLDGRYKGTSSVSFTVEKGRVKSFFGFVPIFCSRVFGNGLSHFDTSSQFFAAADSPVITTGRSFSGIASQGYRRYSYEGQFVGADGKSVTGQVKANYTKTTLDPFPENAFDTTTYSCTGSAGYTATRQ